MPSSSAAWYVQPVGTLIVLLFYRQQAIGDVYPSFTSNMLLEPGLDEERETAIKWAANSIYGGGTDPVCGLSNISTDTKLRSPRVLLRLALSSYS
jgi:hypothetical protein